MDIILFFMMLAFCKPLLQAHGLSFMSNQSIYINNHYGCLCRYSAYIYILFFEFQLKIVQRCALMSSLYVPSLSLIWVCIHYGWKCKVCKMKKVKKKQRNYKYFSHSYLRISCQDMLQIWYAYTPNWGHHLVEFRS